MNTNIHHSNNIMRFFYNPTGKLYINQKSSFSATTYELKLIEENGILKQEKITPFKLLKPDCGWLESIEPEEHLDEATVKIKKNLINKKNILCFSYKDISLANRLKEEKTNIDVLFSSKNGIFGNDFEDMEEKAIFENLKTLKIKYDLIIIRHYLEHFEDINNIMKNLNANLNKDGICFLEVPDCDEFIKNKNPIFLWEQHRWYFTYNSLLDWLINSGWNNIESYSAKYKMEPSLCYLLRESKLIKFHLNIEKKLNKTNKNLDLEIFNDYINEWKEFFRTSSNKIAIIGIGHNSDRFLQITNARDKVSYLIDDAIDKQGKFIAQCRIKITNNKELLDAKTIILLGVHPRSAEKLKKSLMSRYKFKQIYSIFKKPIKL